MARCNECNRFVSHDMSAELIEDSADGEKYTATVRIVLTCMECGGELVDGEAYFEKELVHTCEGVPCACGHVKAEHDLSGKCAQPAYLAPDGGLQIAIPFDCECEAFEAPEPDFSAGEAEVGADSFSEGQGRGRKTYYFASVDATVTCENCGDEIAVQGETGRIRAREMSPV